MLNMPPNQALSEALSEDALLRLAQFRGLAHTSHKLTSSVLFFNGVCGTCFAFSISHLLRSLAHLFVFLANLFTRKLFETIWASIADGVEGAIIPAC
jgi:hypothetical protein